MSDNPEALRRAIECIRALADQQAMPDDFWKAEVSALEAVLAQQAAPTDTHDALRRLWPIIERALDGLVFTADKAGEVAADMATVRAALAQQAATPTEADFTNYPTDPRERSVWADGWDEGYKAGTARQAATPAPMDWTEIDARLDKAVQCLGWNKAQHEIAALLREVAARGVQAATPAPAEQADTLILETSLSLAYSLLNHVVELDGAGISKHVRNEIRKMLPARFPMSFQRAAPPATPAGGPR